MAFPGGKGKTYQHLINLMPKHDVYIEPFLGSAAVVKNKSAAKSKTIVNDLERAFTSNAREVLGDNIEILNDDALKLLNSVTLCDNTLVYCDPPYVKSSRFKSKLYKYEYEDYQHEELLKFLCKQKCMVMISGYQNSLYEKHLANWNVYSFNSQTQKGIREEFVWYNYNKPVMLHDARYLGGCFREREKIKKRTSRLKKKFLSMEPVERSAFIEWLNDEFSIIGASI